MERGICIIIGLLYLIPVHLLAQDQARIDSLLATLSKPDDTSKVNSLNALAWEHRSKDRELAAGFADQAIGLAEELEYTKGMAAAHNNLGSFNYMSGNYEDAIAQFELATELFNYIADSARVAKALNNIGLSYNRLGQYTDAIGSYENSLAIKERMGDQKGMASSFKNIGNVYQNLGDLEEAINSFLKALKILEAEDDQKGVASIYNNIGNIYYAKRSYGRAEEYYVKSLGKQVQLGNQKGMASAYSNLGNIYRSQEDYPLAIENFQKSLDIYTKLENKGGIAQSLNNMGVTYYHWGDFTKAIKNFKEILRINEEVGNQRGIAIGSLNISSVYADRGNFLEAISYCNRSLMIARQIGARDLVVEAYDNLSVTYSKQRNFDEALRFHKMHMALKDSLFNEESSQQIVELEAKYESEKKQNEIDLLTSQREIQDLALSRNNFLTWAAVGGLLLIGALALVILRSYRQKQKANTLLETQNEEITNQKGIIEEKNKNILDSIKYAKRIQRAILPTDEQVQELLPEAFILYMPKDIVSGDFYWIEQKDNKVMFAAVDCTGHGVPGAFMSIVGNNGLNQTLHEMGKTRPSDILDAFNVLVNETLHQREEGSVRDGMDIAICAMDRDTGKLEFAGANNPLYVIQQQELTVIKGDSQPVGSFFGTEPQPFSNHEVCVEPGDMIYVFSDGFADQFGGPKGKKFKYKPFRELLLAIHTESLERQKELLRDTFEKWKGPIEQIDDICVIGVRI